MRRSAVRGAAGGKLAVTAVAALCAFALAACGGEQGGAAATDSGKPTAAANGGPTGGPASQVAGQGSATATPTAAAALDTTSWVLPPPFYAAGDEPFWRLDIVDGWFSFKRSGLPEIEAPMTQPARTNGADVFDAPPLKIRIKREACQTDEGGKGDISAVVTFDDTEFEGCAFSGTSNAVSAEASTVVDALKAIDACLGKLGDPAIVTAVYPREGDRTAVALKAKDGSLYECAVESDGSIAFLDPTEPRSAGAWMTKFRFLRKGVADATKCDGAEEVRSGDQVVGRLLAKPCKF